MNHMQLYLTIGIPTLAVLVGILVNVTQFAAMNARMASLESRFDLRFSSLESRIDSRFNNFEGRFEMLLSKVIDIDNRLTRVEERLRIQ